MRALAVVPLLIVLAGFELSSAGVLPAMLEWGVVALAALLGLAISLYIFVAWVRERQRGLWAFVIVAILPLLVATPMVIRDLSYPAINDVTADTTTRIIEGEAASPMLGFIDDFVIRVSDEDGKTRVDMPSKSRDGVGDAGANAKRIRGFLRQLGGP